MKWDRTAETDVPSVLLIREESAVRPRSTRLACDRCGRPAVARVCDAHDEALSLGRTNRPCGLSSRNV
jgi:hypothetical protein